jgi:hypothetical protein
MRLVNQLSLITLLASLFAFIASVFATRRKWHTTSFLSLFLGIVTLLAGLLIGSLAIGTYGYRALTREVVAATVRTERLDQDSFGARFEFPNGDTLYLQLAGDELYVDAHILKWKPIGNLLGLHTDYELDRVAGRYVDLEEEQSKARTVYSIAAPKPYDLFDIARRRPLLLPFVDAEYGSASFVPAQGTYELRVSMTGLLFRRLSE